MRTFLFFCWPWCPGSWFPARLIDSTLLEGQPPERGEVGVGVEQRQVREPGQRRRTQPEPVEVDRRHRRSRCRSPCTPVRLSHNYSCCFGHCFPIDHGGQWGRRRKDRIRQSALWARLSSTQGEVYYLIVVLIRANSRKFTQNRIRVMSSCSDHS
jgi:hypothetical protein